MQITLPTSRLQKCLSQPKLEKGHKLDMNNAAAQAYVATVQNMKSSDYRKLYRKMQLKTVVLKEVKQSLKTTSFQRSVSLGPLNFEHDFDIFGLRIPDVRSATFELKRDNLSELDTLLGEKWDLRVHEAGANFVTAFKVRITQDYALHLSVKTATAMLTIDTESPRYRQQIFSFLSRQSDPAITSCQEEE